MNPYINADNGVDIVLRDKWDKDNPVQVAYSDAKEDEIFFGYFVLSHEQKVTCEAIEYELDQMLKRILTATVSEDTIKQHLGMGNFTNDAKGIDIFRNMRQAFDHISEVDFQHYKSVISNWRFSPIVVNPTDSIQNWRMRYNILYKFDKISHDETMTALTAALNTSYTLKVKMADDSAFASATQAVRNSLTVDQFFAEMIKEHMLYAKSHPKEVAAAKAEKADKQKSKKAKLTVYQEIVDNPNLNPTRRNGKYKEEKRQHGTPEINPNAGDKKCQYCGGRRHKTAQYFLTAPGAIPSNWFCTTCNSFYDEAGMGHFKCRKAKLTANHLRNANNKHEDAKADTVMADANDSDSEAADEDLEDYSEDELNGNPPAKNP